MKYVLCLFLLLTLYLPQAKSQGGVWTWMRGDGNTNLSAGSYGTQGVPALTNNPPSRYNTSHWSDTAGNFWIFGGFRNNGTNFTDLWKYEPLTNTWTWMKGNMNGAGSAGNFGTQGVAAASNNPPANSLTSVTWTDTSSNLWLYHKFGDLWKYDIVTNLWTWMNGSGVASQPAVYGTQGIPAPANKPGSNIENKAAWTDSMNNLWLYNKGNMWRYSIITNEWTWMKGNGAVNVANYGTQGVPDPLVQPEQNDSYIQWKDLQDNFYIATNGYPGTSSTIWKYHIDINQWSWHSGDTALNASTQNRKFISQCVASTDRDPGHRLEARGTNYTDKIYCAGDSIFWFHGGAHSIAGTVYNNNDLWVFNRLNNTWKWVSGDSTLNTSGNYGVQGIPSPTNMPYSMNGHAMWVDKQQQVWVWGGKSDIAVNNNNLWRFTPDTNCIKSAPTQFANLVSPGNQTICSSGLFSMPVDPTQSYVISPQLGVQLNAGNDTIHFSPLSTTTYTMVAQSTQNCVAPKQISFTVQVNNFPTYSIPPHDTICSGSSTVLQVSNPPVGLQFVWLPMNVSGNSVTVTPASLTIYTLVASYPGSGCPNDTSFIQITPTTLTWNTVSTTNNACFGQSNGSISTQANALSSIIYTLQPGNQSNSSGNFTGIAAGNYTITATDANNCSISTIVSVTQPTALQLTLINTTQPGCINNNGEVQVQYTGGVGSINYTLLPIGATNSLGQFTGLGQGNYTVVASDANNCSASTTVNLTIPNGIQITTISTLETGCTGPNTGSATISVNGGLAPVEYSIGGSFQLSPVFNSLGAGNYVVIVKDANNCTDTAAFTISIKNAPTIQNTIVQQPLCFPELDGVIQITAFSDTSISSYTLLPDSITQLNGNFTQLSSGTYTIIVTDAGGCTATTTVLLNPVTEILLNFTQVINSVCNANELGKIMSSAQGGNGGFTFTLLPNGITNTTGVFDNLIPGKYQVVVTDSKNCKKGDSVEIVRIECCSDVSIPNAFTPNGDNLNDELPILHADHIEVIKFVIANRWGNLVFVTTENKAWDGRYKNVEASSDTYYYFLQYKCITDGKEYLKKGDIILMR